MDTIKPIYLQHIDRNDHHDNRVHFNNLIDVINALSDRLAIVESQLANRQADPRRTHERDARQVKPV